MISAKKREGGALSSEDRLALIKELGDVLWYVAAIASELDTDLGFVAEENLRKLNDRKARGVIPSEGDNR
ncbi:MAG TPA: MazG nucleotide pyrophosphohydrolase domain-containing protein [Candidatus Sulfotelmatobacter sp.]